MHTEEGCRLFQVAARDNQTVQHAAQLGDEITVCPCQQRLRLRFKDSIELRVGAAHRVIEPGRRKDQRGLIGIKAHRGLEEPLIGFGVHRGCVTEQDVTQPELGSAQSPHDVAANRNGGVVDLVGSDYTLLINGVTQEHHLVLNHQGRNGPAVLQLQVKHQVTQCRPDVGRVLHQQAHNTERRSRRVLPHQETELGTAAPGYAFPEEPPHDSEGDGVIRIVEKAEIDTDLRRHGGEVDTHIAQQVWYRADGSHASGAVHDQRQTRTGPAR